MVDQFEGKEVMGVKPNEGSKRKFQCEYCWQQFYSSHSLGGHQNAHKKERAASKKAKQAVELFAMAPPPPPPPPHLYPFMLNSQSYASPDHFKPSYYVNPHPSHNSDQYHPYARFYGDAHRTVNNGTIVDGNRIGECNIPYSIEDSSSKAGKWISMMTPKEASSELDVMQGSNMSKIAEKEIDENKLDLSLHL